MYTVFKNPQDLSSVLAALGPGPSGFLNTLGLTISLLRRQIQSINQIRAETLFIAYWSHIVRLYDTTLQYSDYIMCSVVNVAHQRGWLQFTDIACMHNIMEHSVRTYTTLQGTSLPNGYGGYHHTYVHMNSSTTCWCSAVPQASNPKTLSLSLTLPALWGHRREALPLGCPGNLQWSSDLHGGHEIESMNLEAPTTKPVHRNHSAKVVVILQKLQSTTV